MICDPEKHRRRSIRLKGHDYAQPGAYFVTICTHQWAILFGEVAAGSVALNPMGQVVNEEWLRTAEVRPNVELDAFAIMPNHVHGIVMIIDHGRGVLQYAPTPSRFVSPSQTVGAIIRGFKSATAKRINRLGGHRAGRSGSGTTMNISSATTKA